MIERGQRGRSAEEARNQRDRGPRDKSGIAFAAAFVEQIQPRPSVRALSLYSLERDASARRQGREGWIVLDHSKRTLARQWHLHPRIENVLRIERHLHLTKSLERLARPYTIHERGTE